MAKALVTGGAGFLGSHLADYLIEEMGAEVVVLDDLSGGFADNVHPEARLVEGSIVDHDLVDRLFASERFDFVYHLAAYAAEGLSHFIKRFNHTNNLIGSVNLINAAVNTGVRCFVFTSSIAVYGAGQLPMREDMLPRPEDSYGIAKLAVEQELEASRAMFGLDYVIFRPHNVYGPRQNLGDRYRNVVGIFMNRLMRGEELIIFGDGDQQRAFTYVDDVIPAMARSAELDRARNRIFNAGADAVYSVNELAERVMQAMGLHGELRHVEARNEVYRAWSDHSRFRSVFPGAASTSIEDGLARMAAWANEAGVRSSAPFEAIEIRKNLPAAWLESPLGDPG
ncbi:MAG: NAD-dependent epimerase/dehydratase family protein [Deltaproteobacteria bacterium]|nr:NAD-dependent epimerase/dehydratase family protein [Deltaproteobacteria bacterium]